MTLSMHRLLDTYIVKPAGVFLCHAYIRTGSILHPDSLVDFREEKKSKKT